MNRRILALLLVLVMVAGLMTGCASGRQEAAAPETAQPESPAAEETAAAKADTAATANGYGLLDTGTGSLDKVLVKDGHLVDCDCGEMYALCMIAGKTFRVQGTALVEAE